MSKYRFSGTLKEVASSPTNKILKFRPDQECSVVMKCGKDETKFVVFLPMYVKGSEGIAFKYDDNVSVEIKLTGTWLPVWKVNAHYEFVLETIDATKCEFEAMDAPISKWFHVFSISEKA